MDSLASAPYRFYKQNQFEDGVATPAVFHWPAGFKTEPGFFERTPTHLMAPEREQRPVSTADEPKHHPEWSNSNPEPGHHTGNR